MKGRVNSFQSLGTVDGPGIRYVVFLQGCPLRCGCCHNPDTWDINGGTEYLAEEIVSKAVKFKPYFRDKGGITISGGEPLLQAEFVSEVFSLAKEKGINTCLDTSGCIINDSVKNMLSFTDRVLLDIKYLDNEKYLKFVGCSFDKVIEFLDLLKERDIKTTVRQVIIPTLNDDKNNIIKLKELLKNYPNVDKVELLPFKKICEVKYNNLNIEFPFKDIETPTKEKMQELEKSLRS